MKSIPLPRTSGIYQITCIPTGKIYIGSAQDMLDRSWRHRQALRANAHTNPRLQRAWNKYGADAFVFTVLEMCPACALLDREQHYIDTIKPYDRTIGFNCATSAHAPGLGRKVSAEARRKISEANRNQSTESRQRGADARRGGKRTAETRAKIAAAVQKQTAETRQKQAAANRGRIVSDETRQKMSESHRRRFMDPAAHKKLSDAHYLRYSDPEERKRASDAVRRGWETRRARKK